MRRLALLTGIGVCILAGCGSGSPKARSQAPVSCPPPAHIGCSLPKGQHSFARTLTGRAFPDISEFQGCPAFSGSVIFKVYEGGYGQDHSSRCNAARVHRLHTWAGVYAFLRPRDCAGQARATVAILRALGGVPGPVVADAEVPLPSGCVSSFVAVVRSLRGGPVDVYTAPGTWPGGPLPAALWVATYGPRPGCVAGVCAHVAWQFSDASHCGGIFGDCSVDSGILAQTRIDNRKPRLYADYRRRSLLRSFARHRNCYQPHRKQACKVWGSEVQVLEADIRRLHAEGVF